MHRKDSVSSLRKTAARISLSTRPQSSPRVSGLSLKAKPLIFPWKSEKTAAQKQSTWRPPPDPAVSEVAAGEAADFTAGGEEAVVMVEVGEEVGQLEVVAVPAVALALTVEELVI